MQVEFTRLNVMQSVRQDTTEHKTMIEVALCNCCKIATPQRDWDEL
jgi:hypothetical protein